MQASKIEYRLRGLIMTIIVLLGFWAPWIQALDLGKRVSLLEWMALELSRTGLLRFTYATPVVIAAGTLLAALGMILRVWGTAYMGAATVNKGSLQAGALRIDGPYRHVRNPLFLGTWFMLAAVAFLMPPTGALFAIPLLTLFLLRLVLAEEKFLAAALGETYRLYRQATPRLLPRLRSPLPRSGQKPHWLLAVASELNAINVFVILAFLSWSYDHELMIKGLLVGFGVSLVARALIVENGEEPRAENKI
jgi:protein-S-isoprenylcysteine O-methyltransferase Ste14